MTDLLVLLVEDEPLNRALVRAILQRANGPMRVTLLEAGTIGRARELLELHPVDVLLLDVRLPDGSGLDLGRELRERRDAGGGARSGLPLVAILSASVLPGEREAAERTGADAFVGKPFAPGELVRLLEQFGGTIADRRDGADGRTSD
jgi:two-component system KDP operon response regulator KdpE